MSVDGWIATFDAEDTATVHADVVFREGRKPLNPKCLEGAPWDAGEEPRLEVRRTALRNQDGDKPTIRIEVRCRREDILIDDLTLKNPKKQSLFKLRPNRAVNLAAAEQVIKEELLSAGFLRVPDMSEEYTEVVIADVIISEDW